MHGKAVNTRLSTAWLSYFTSVLLTLTKSSDAVREKVKVALIQPNRHGDSHRLPLGLLSVGTVIKKAGHIVEIIDADLLGLSPEQVLPLVKDFDVVGLTAMTPSYPEAEAIAGLIKDNYPDKWTIIAG